MGRASSSGLAAALLASLLLSACAVDQEAIELTNMTSTAVAEENSALDKHAKRLEDSEKVYAKAIAEVEALTAWARSIHAKTQDRDRAYARPAELGVLEALKSYPQPLSPQQRDVESRAAAILAARAKVGLPAEAVKKTLEQLAKTMTDAELEDVIKAFAEFAEAVKVPQQLKDALAKPASDGEVNAVMLRAIAAVDSAGAELQRQCATDAACVRTKEQQDRIESANQQVKEAKQGREHVEAKRREVEVQVKVLRQNEGLLLAYYSYLVTTRATLARAQVVALWQSIDPLRVPSDADVRKFADTIEAVERLVRERASAAAIVAAVTDLAKESAALRKG